MRNRQAKGASAVAVTGLALLLLGGCSNDGTSSSAPEPVSSSTPEAMAETDAEPTEGSRDEMPDVSEPPLEPEAPIATDDGAAFAPSDVTRPPSAIVERLALETDFYERYLDAMGIPVVSSGRVSPHALAETRWIIERMLERREDVAQTIARSSVRVAIMAVDEYTTDIPEHADLTPSDWWDVRARGLGATDRRPAQSVGEENLLGLAGDPYLDESIMVHEFAHVVHQQGMNTLEPGFDDRLQAIFEQAMAEGLWEGTYATVDRSEYFAEGVQSWFDTNREDDDQHGPVDTREELASHDPRLAALLGEVFGDNAWRYLRPQDRETGAAHLEGFDRDAATAFEWPAELLSIDTTREPSEEGAVLLADVSHEDWSAQRSPRNGAAETTLTIVNRRSTDVGLRWVDFDGGRVAYGGIAANGTGVQRTFPGHLFEITGPDGGVIGQYRAPLGDGIIEIDD